MHLSRKFIALAAPIALLAVSGCARDFSANVSRFQRLPVPEGQTFRVVPGNPDDRGGLEFGSYASLVAQRLAQQGYRPSEGGPTDMVVKIDYGVGNPQQKVTTGPGGFCGGGFGPGLGWGGGWGRGWGGGWGGWGWNYGWGGPGFGGGFGCPDVQSYTVFQSWLTMDITRADGTKLFEGRARAQSATDNLTYLVPNLIDAMFTGFPGNSGQDIRITISQDQQKQRQAPPAGQPRTNGGPTY